MQKLYTEMTEGELQFYADSAPQWPNGYYDAIPYGFDHCAAERGWMAKDELRRRANLRQVVDGSR